MYAFKLGVARQERLYALKGFGDVLIENLQTVLFGKLMNLSSKTVHFLKSDCAGADPGADKGRAQTR